MIKKIRRTELAQVSQWFKARGEAPPSFQRIHGAMGYMADNRVACWLVPTATSVAIIDGLISNPETVPSLRRESMVKLTGFLVDTALALGYTDIVCASRHPSVHKVAKQLGFEKTDLTFFVLSGAGHYENNLGQYIVENADKFDIED